MTRLMTKKKAREKSKLSPLIVHVEHGKSYVFSCKQIGSIIAFMSHVSDAPDEFYDLSYWNSISNGSCERRDVGVTMYVQRSGESKHNRRRTFKSVSEHSSRPFCSTGQGEQGQCRGEHTDAGLGCRCR